MLDINLKNLKPPYLIHSDIFRASIFLKKFIESFDHDQNKLKQFHLDFLLNLLGEYNLIFPSFNYDFPKSKIFDIINTPSQVGHLTNYILDKSSFVRTRTPVFSFLTKIKDLYSIEHFQPFSIDSVFDFIFKNDGSIIFYGADINSSTYLHYVESQFGPPMYRYDKTFSGTLINYKESKKVQVSYHVLPFSYHFLPLGMILDYNWNYLYALLESKKVLNVISNYFFGVKARELSEIWGEIYLKSQFNFLDDQSRKKMQDKINQLGRRLLITDFEF